MEGHSRVKCGCHILLLAGLVLVTGSGVSAHPNPEIARHQERLANEAFNARAEDVGLSAGPAVVILRAAQVGHAIRHPVVSPDGKRLAFTNPRQDVLAVYDVETQEVRSIAADAGVGTDYAWDGSGALLYRKQAEKQRGKGHEVWRRDFSADAPARMRSFDGPVRLVPVHGSGTVLVADAGGKLLTLDPDSSPDEGIQPITDLRGQVVRLSAGKKPDVLNDEEEQCFDVQHSPGGDVFVYSDLDTLKLRKRIGDPAGVLGYGLHPRWSPDGSCLVYQVTFDDGHTVVKSELAVSAPDGSRQARLTSTDTFHEAEPCWLPDGSALLCTCEKSGDLLRIPLSKPPLPVVQGAQ